MKKHIEKAEQVLADLRTQREALIERGHDLEKRRQEVAFAAHTGSKKERAKLDEINNEAYSHTITNSGPWTQPLRKRPRSSQLLTRQQR
jgi:hypothetical protein